MDGVGPDHMDGGVAPAPQPVMTEAAKRPRTIERYTLTPFEGGTSQMDDETLRDAAVFRVESSTSSAREERRS